MDTDTTPVTLEELMGPEVDSAPWVQQAKDWAADRRARRAAEDRAADEATRTTLTAVLDALTTQRNEARHNLGRLQYAAATFNHTNRHDLDVAQGKVDGLTDAVDEIRAAIAHLTN